MKQAQRHVCKFWFTLILMSVANLLWAQPADTVRLAEVQVQTARYSQFVQGSKTQRFDSLSLAQFRLMPVSDLLAASTPMFIRSYGLGSLASPSLRGTGAAHTAVVWNGFNLQSAMLGQVDFSLIPVMPGMDMRLQYGGGSALYGSGAIGGTLFMQQAPADEKGVSASVMQSAGSFGTWRSGISFAAKGRKMVYSAGFYRTQASNNFSFSNTAQFGAPEQRLSHAALFKQGMMLDAAWQQPAGGTLSFHYWADHTQRNLPPTMVQMANWSQQEDKAQRVAIDWKKRKGKWLWQMRSAYFYEELHYTDPVTKVFSHSFTHTQVAEAEASYHWGVAHKLNLGCNNTFQRANTQSYSFAHNLWKQSVFTSYRYAAKKISAVQNLRREMVNGKLLPFTSFTGLEYAFSKWLQLRANTSYNYRIPTLNDRYWQPGGNPGLLPEKSLNAEAGLRAQTQYKKHKLEIGLSVYSNTIRDCIIWLPDSQLANVWRPQNQARVWSRGVEWELNYRLQLGRQSGISLGGNYTYLFSTSEQSHVANDASLHKQLIYVPRQTATARLNLWHRGWTMGYTHGYTGLRFTSSDNSYYLDPFHVASLHLGKSLKCFGVHELSCSAGIKNIWNTQYQVMAWRPMPGRYVEFTLQFHFKPIKNKQT